MFVSPGSRSRPQKPVLRSGRYRLTETVTGNTNVVLPTSGTLAALQNANTWSALNTFTSQITINSSTANTTLNAVSTAVTSVSQNIVTQTLGTVNFKNEDGGIYFQITPSSSAALQNLIAYSGVTAGTGTAPYMAVISQNNTDANVGLIMSTRGTGSFLFYTQSLTNYTLGISSAQVAIQSTAAATNTVSGSLTTAGGIGVALSGFFGGTVTTGSSTFMSRTSIALVDGSSSKTATLTNSPVTGNATKWIPIDDNGTTRYIPAW
jgi:hypothetical protein